MRLVEKAQKGDKGALQQIIDCYTGYFVKLMKDNNLKREDYEDGMNCAVIGLMKALKNYDINRDIKIMTYAKRFIDYELTEFIREKMPFYVTRRNYYREKDKIKAMSSIDISCIEESEIKEIENFENEICFKCDYENAIKKLLDNTKREILEQFYIYGKSSKEIAEVLNLESEKVIAIKKKAIKTLKLSTVGRNLLYVI